MRTLCAILCFVVGICFAGPGPAFEDLDGVARHPLDPGQKAASVLIFYSQDCPISNGYAPEINRLCASNSSFAFYIVQVDPDLALEAARKHAREYGLSPPVLLDPKHLLVKLAKATVTPEAVVMDKNGRALYRGRIDDLYAALGKKRATVTQHELQAALNDIAAGQPVKEKQTKAVGCLIQPTT